MPVTEGVRKQHKGQPHTSSRSCLEYLHSREGAGQPLAPAWRLTRRQALPSAGQRGGGKESRGRPQRVKPPRSSGQVTAEPSGALARDAFGARPAGSGSSPPPRARRCQIPREGSPVPFAPDPLQEHQVLQESDFPGDFQLAPGQGCSQSRAAQPLLPRRSLYHLTLDCGNISRRCGPRSGERAACPAVQRPRPSPSALRRLTSRARDPFR